MKAKHNGGYAPFGYDVVNQEYVVNELEAGFVQKIFNAAANREGFTAIIEELAAAGITGKRGKPIKYTQIYEMLRNGCAIIGVNQQALVAQAVTLI